MKATPHRRTLTAAGIAADLRRCGVCKGRPASRDHLATELEGDVRQGDIEALFVEVRDTRRADNPAGALFKLLTDGSWRDLLADMAAENPPADPRAPKPYPGTVDHQRQAEARQMTDSERDRAVFVFCRLCHDRAPVDQLMRELELSGREIAAKARDGARVRGYDPDAEEWITKHLLRAERGELPLDADKGGADR